MSEHLIPDQSNFFPSRWTLDVLQKAMEFTPNQFGDFKLVARNIARDFKLRGLEVHKLHNKQPPGVWEGFVRMVVYKVPKLNTFLEHWPVRVYYDFWVAQTVRKLDQPRWKRPSLTIPESMKIKLPAKRVYIGLSPQPLKSITNCIQNTTRPSVSAIAKLNLPDIEVSLRFEGPFDRDMGIPCLLCQESPRKYSYRLTQILNADVFTSHIYAKMGLRCNLDLDTLILIGPVARRDLFLSSALTNEKIASIESRLEPIQARVHVRPNISEKELRDYLTNIIYSCIDHPALGRWSPIPRKLRKLFNKAHIEHLIPTVISLGIKSDVDYHDIVLRLDHNEREEKLFNRKHNVSPLDKLAILWAFELSAAAA